LIKGLCHPEVGGTGPFFVKLGASILQQERERQSGYDTANDNGKVYIANRPLARAPVALVATKFIVKRGSFRAFCFAPHFSGFSS
jgi:ethanolamine utilization microcompartment shell protein EutL